MLRSDKKRIGAIGIFCLLLTLLLFLDGGRRLFQLEPGEIDSIRIAGSLRDGKTVTYQSAEEIELLTEYFNGFSYYSIFPAELPGSTSRCPVTLVRKDGVEIPFTVLPEGVILDGNTYLCHSPYVNHGPYFQPLVDLAAREEATARAANR